jgi:hypothetical protein
MSQIIKNTSSGGGGGITTIAGDTGSATGSTINLHGQPYAGGTVLFDASSATVNLKVTDTANNTFVGLLAGNPGIVGAGNTAFGLSALASISTGGVNTVVGSDAATSMVSGNGNIAIGSDSLLAEDTGSANTVIGTSALISATGGSSSNTVIGFFAAINTVDSTSNIVIGNETAAGWTGGESNNIILGNFLDSTPAITNTINIGSQPSTGTYDATFIGGINGFTGSAGTQMVTIDSTDQLGVAPLPSGEGITTLVATDSGTATGSSVTITGTDGAHTIASGSTMTIELRGPGTRNTFLGESSGNAGVSGNANTSVGSASLNAISTGGSNAFVGDYCGVVLDTGSQNVGMGQATMLSLTSGSNNVAIGWAALNGLVNGNYNIAIGNQAGEDYTTNESNNITISSLSTTGVTGESNTLRIGDSTGTGQGQLNQAFISGINGTTGTGTTVGVTSGNQLTAGGVLTNSSQPAFLVNLSSSPTNVTGAGAAYTVPFDTVLFDQSSSFNTGTSQFIAPVAGVYWFNVQIFSNNISTQNFVAMNLVTNDGGTDSYNLCYQGVIAANAQMAVRGGALALLAAGETVQVQFVMDGGPGDVGIYLNENLTYFSGYLVC